MGESDFECILWDFGGVFTGSPFYSIDNYAGYLGVKPQGLIELVLGYGLEDGDHHWHRLERGEITMVKALKEIEALISASGIQGFGLRDFFKSFIISFGSSRPICKRTKCSFFSNLKYLLLPNSIGSV